MNRTLVVATTVLIGVVVVLVASIGFWGIFGDVDFENVDKDIEGGSLEVAAEQLRLHRVALTAMDNLQTVQAAAAWGPLAEANPDDPSIAINRALTAVLRLDELATRAGDASASAEDKQAARAQLPPAIAAARQFTEKYRAIGGDPNIVTWLTTRVDLREAALLPASMTRSIRREVFDRLVKQINQIAGANGDAGQPESAPETNLAPETESGSGSVNGATNLILIAGQLISVLELMEDPIEGIPRPIVEPAAQALATLSRLRPENLYLALRAAQTAILARSPQAAELIKRTQTLARSIRPTLERQTRSLGKTPDQWVDEMIASVDAGEFDEAEGKMLLWFNLLNSTELIKTDRRRAMPHPLDKVSFDSLRAIAEKVAQARPLNPVTDAIPFRLEPIADVPAEVLAAKTIVHRDLVAIDADLDFHFDFVSLASDGEKTSLALWMNANAAVETATGETSSEETATDETGAEWTRATSLEIAGDFHGMIVADLFVVDSSSPDRVRVSTGSNQHNTLRSVIAFGRDGIRLVDVDARVGIERKSEPSQEENGDADSSTMLAVAKAETGLEDIKGIVSMTAGDLEGDGDLDLIIATADGPTLMINRGNRTFFAVPESIARATSWDRDDPPVAMAIADFDRDLDLDILTVHPKSGRVGWIENLLHLQFRFQYFSDIEPVENADGIAVEDFDGNVSWDLLVSSPKGGKVVRTRTSDAGIWEIIDQESFAWPRESSSDASSKTRLADFDNDGFFEAIRSVSGESDGIQIGPGPIVRQPVRLAAGAESITPAMSSLVVVDINGDRRLDIAGFTGGGSETGTIAVAVNAMESNANVDAVAVRFKGIDDNNVNSGRVNHYAIGSVLELRFGPHYRARIVTDPVTHFGIDGIEKAANLRVIFPNGLTQTVPEVAPGMLIEEEQTLKGSCPYLYAFNGERFEFVTDCLWAAPLGLQVSPGVVVPDRPWEHLKVDGKCLAARDGAYELRITEELWEIAYFDELKLTAVDHPEDVEIFTNEKVGPAQIATPKIHAFETSDLRPVLSAVDSNGDDATQRLSRIDGRHVQAFDRRLRQGLCPPHWIELDLSDRIEPLRVGGELPSDIEVKLVLTGWILPTDTSLNIQIDQNPLLPSPEPPSLWVPAAQTREGESPPDADTFVKVDPYIGFPGGKNKSIVVNVTEHLDPSDARVRIQTSQQIYWDAAFASVRSRSDAARVEASVQTRPLPLIAAEVGWHGFSRRFVPGPNQAENYDYEDVLDSPRWPPLGDEFTRYGAVADLLSDWDDRMVVIGGGDEIRLRFEATDQIPQLRRDFVLYGVGWDKDADLNTLAGQSSLPLPSRKMAAYPPRFDEIGQADTTLRANRSHLKRRQPFRRFWSPPNLNPKAYVP